MLVIFLASMYVFIVHTNIVVVKLVDIDIKGL